MDYICTTGRLFCLNFIITEPSDLIPQLICKTTPTLRTPQQRQVSLVGRKNSWPPVCRHLAARETDLSEIKYSFYICLKSTMLKVDQIHQQMKEKSQQNLVQNTLMNGPYINGAAFRRTQSNHQPTLRSNGVHVHSSPIPN